MSSTRTDSQFCTATPISPSAQCSDFISQVITWMWLCLKVATGYYRRSPRRKCKKNYQSLCWYMLLVICYTYLAISHFQISSHFFWKKQNRLAYYVTRKTPEANSVVSGISLFLRFLWMLTSLNIYFRCIKSVLGYLNNFWPKFIVSS